MTKRNQVNPTNAYGDAPETLSGHLFYGLRLDLDQERFRDAIWDSNKLVIFANACAGSGKTQIATATANLLVEYGKYDGICYICSPYGEGKQGFLPGSITEKSEVYYEPFYQALIKINLDPMRVINEASMVNQKLGTGYISCMTHTYLRGTNFEKKVVILDEAQNYSFDDLKKTLTRISDSCKVIVIGHDKQCDLAKNDNAFVRYLEHFRTDERCQVCTLTKNYRGWISRFADSLL